MSDPTVFNAACMAQASALIDSCRSRGLKLTIAESCTGGLLAGAVTAIAGASDVFETGFVTYSNAAKIRLLGIPSALIESCGAVSEETARAMAEGALSVTGADIALAVTGIAGPGGGSAEKPVGLVHICAARRGFSTLHRKLMLGDIGRERIRLQSVSEALAVGRAQAGSAAP